jgi:uncharacterized protein YjbI with pentapeptide repeats
MPNREHIGMLCYSVREWNEWRQSHPEIEPWLSDVVLSSVSFPGINFSDAVLDNADLSYVDFSGANLRRAYLKGASLKGANLSNADLSDADLSSVDLSHADLSHADFTNVHLGFTTFGENDLSKVRGLETVKHKLRSFIGISTIYKSQGNIPENFLRGCGIPEDFITYMRSLAVQPIQFYTSFISYSGKDQKFADRLYADLQSKGVRCWLATKDLKIGDRIRVGIDEAIRIHDKLLLVLSKHSVASDWVEQEVETALERERKEKRTVLFPIRLDDAVMKVESGWPALIRNTRNIGDFRKWKNHDSYQKAFDRLLRDLKAEA